MLIKGLFIDTLIKNLKRDTQSLYFIPHQRFCQNNADKNISENDYLSYNYYNRNPRNLEQLRLEPKPQGYSLEDYSVDFWNRLFFNASNKHTSAWVQHHSGTVIISASTKEWAIAKFLYSLTDVSATMNIARVLADRCLKAGINFVDIKGFGPKMMESEKLKIFCKTLEESGLALREPNHIDLYNYNAFK